MNQLQRMRQQQATLARVGDLAIRSDNLDEILTEACLLVSTAMSTDLVRIMQLQDDGETLLVRAGMGWQPDGVDVPIVNRRDILDGFVVRTGRPLLSQDMESEVRSPYLPFLVQDDLRAVIDVLIIGGKDRPPFGILQVDSREGGDLTEDDTIFLSAYANLLAAAVDRLRLLGNLHNKEAQLQQVQKLEAIREEKLRQGQKLEAIGRLAAGVAHDFNNILQSVGASLELILDEAIIGTSVHEYAEIGLTSARRGSYLTQHLLSYARKQMLRPEQINVAEFLPEMQRLLSLTLSTLISVRVRTEQPLPTINADPGQLQTALLNLAINASHAMPQGGKLLLDAYAGGPLEDFVVIVVTDTGMGMDTATRARAFEPFFTTKGVDGSGLGLSMVQGFVQQSGGQVKIESTLGTGTKIEMWLPAASLPTSPQMPVSSKQMISNIGRILVVDDNSDVLLTTSVFLESAGFQVVRAESGDRALALMASGEHFDGLVSDYLMPGMHGLDLIDQAREVQPGLAALVITGFAEATGATTLARGVEILRKPFQRAHLIAALSHAMGREVAAEGAKTPLAAAPPTVRAT